MSDRDTAVADRSAERSPAVFGTSHTPLWGLLLPLALAIFLGYGALGAVQAFGKAIAIFILGVTIANALYTPVDYLERYLPRALAVAAVFLGIFGVIALIGWLIIPTLVAQARNLASRAPELASVVRERLNDFFPGNVLENVWSQIGPVADDLLKIPVGIGTAVLTAAVVLFLAIYWLLGKAARERFIASLFPPDRARRVLEVQQKMGRAAGGYVRGTVINATITAAATYIGLLLIGLDFALPLAGLMFLGEFIPFIGPIAAAIPGLVVALADSTSTALWALLVYVVVQQLENQILVPNVMHRQSEAPQSLLVIAVFAGGLVLGILGLLIAVPVAGALTVFVEEVLAPAFRRRMDDAAGPPAEEGA